MFCQLMFFVMNDKFRLGYIWYFTITQFNLKRLLVDGFQETWSELVVNFHRRADDSIPFVLI